MKHLSVMLNDEQADELKLLFEIAWEHAKCQDVLMCDLLPEKIDDLKETIMRNLL